MWTKFILLFCAVLDGINGTKMKKNYNAIPESFSGCGTPTEYNNIDFHLNLKTVNKTAFTVKGYYVITQDIKSSSKFQISADMWKQDQWSVSVFKTEFPTLCSGYKAVSPKLFSTLLGVDVEKEESCNFKTGNYTVDMPPSILEFPNFSTLPFGKYRFVGRCYDGDKKHFCFSVVGVIVPPK